ncbi:MAG: restriction endonuclease subunit S [Rubrivivax sp.]|nr:restriction endonuclease subunit S [Rubrivivax sp.]
MTYEGNCRLGDLFENRREKGRAELPVLSVTMDQGLVDRADLDRKQETSLEPSDHLLVRPGDIAYNMMRMWQGAFGLADRTGIVSPAYVVLKPRAGIDPGYASFLFRIPRMQYLLWAYSYGLTDDRLRLYYQDFAKIPVWVHARARQPEIAAVLAASHDRIALQRALLENSKRVRSALLDRLLKPVGRGRRSKWKEYEFGEIANRVRSTFDPLRSPNQAWCVELEHIEPGLGQLIGSTVTTPAASTKLHFEAGDVLFGKLRPYLRKYWVADRDGVCSSEFWVLRSAAQACTPTFLACLLQSERFMRAAAASAGSKMPRAEWDYVSGTQVEIPPLDEQSTISRRLSPIDDYIKRLGAYVAALQREHHALSLMLFAHRTSPSRRLLA